MARPKLERPAFRLVRRGTNYVVEYWWEGRSHRVSAGTDAELKAREFLAAYEAGWGKEPVPESPVIGRILDGYLADRKGNQDNPLHAPATLEACCKALKRHLGDLLPDLLTPERTRLYARDRREEGYWVGSESARRKKPVQDGTIIRELVTLRAAFKWAVGQKWLAAPPVVEVPQAPPPKDRWLTRAEAAALVGACVDFHTRLYVLLALHTAARTAAILGLTWAAVDMEAGRIDYGTGNGNKGRARGVPISAELRAHLQAAQELALSDFVVEFAGQPVQSIRTGFEASCRRAGLQGVTPHTLRHTAATWVMQKGLPVWEGAGLLGQSDVTTFQRVYGHHSPEHLKAASAAIGRVSSPVGEVTLRVKRPRKPPSA